MHPPVYFFLCLAAMFFPVVNAVINEGLWYSGDGGFVDKCPTSPCDYSLSKCSNGFYLTGCGGASNPTSSGQCLACSGKPADGVWTSNGGSSGVATGCSWGCPEGKVKDNTLNICVPDTCSVSVSNIEYINSNALVCTYQCLAGYYGVTPTTSPPAKGPTTCTPCSPGSFTSAPNSAASCTLCAEGKYAQGTNAVKCDDCPTGTYYALTGASACTPCAADCVAGKFKNGCSGSNAGTCQFCGNPSYP